MGQPNYGLVFINQSDRTDLVRVSQGTCFRKDLFDVDLLLRRLCHCRRVHGSRMAGLQVGLKRRPVGRRYQESAAGIRGTQAQGPPKTQWLVSVRQLAEGSSGSYVPPLYR